LEDEMNDGVRNEETRPEEERSPRPARRLIYLLLAVGALVAVFALMGVPHLLAPTSGEGAGKFGELNTALHNIETPAEVVLGSLSGLGLVAGGAMTAMGMQQGTRIMLTAGMAGGGVMLGKGLIQ
jgi:hypothetical protein